jgi:hypothetical protein
MLCHAHTGLRPRRAALALPGCAADVPNPLVPGSPPGTTAPGKSPLTSSTLLPLVCVSLASGAIASAPTVRPGLFSADAGWRLPVLSVSLSNGRPSMSPGQQPDHYPALGTCGSHAEPRNPEISARSARLQDRSQARCAHTARIEPAIPAQNPQASLVTCGRCRGVTARPARNAAGSNLRHHGYGRSPGLPECGNHMFPARGVKRARPAATLGAGDCCRRARPDEGRNS